MSCGSSDLDEVVEGRTRSDALYPLALRSLCELITAVTGVEPDQDRVNHVSRFWLEQFCDRFLFHRNEMYALVSLEPEVVALGVRSRRGRLLSLLRRKQTPVAVVEPYLKISFASELRAAITCRKRLRWATYPVPMGKQWRVATEKRRQFPVTGDHHGTNEVAFRTALALRAPVHLVEAYHDLTIWAESSYDRSLRVLYTANAHQSSLLFRHWAYVQRRRGTILATHQHGGGYGLDQRHIGEDMDIALSDVFFTFGWTRPDIGDRVRPLPTALPRRSRKRRSRHVLLMSLPVTDRFIRFQSFLVPHQIDRAVAETTNFARSLSNDHRLVVRSSGTDCFPLEPLGRVRSNLGFDTGAKAGTIAASRARVVVHNYLGTSWLETLALDIPTLCFCPPDMYKPRDAAQPFVDGLRRVGILHPSGREAAEFINSLDDRIEEWWQSVEVQSARRSFVERYANFSDDWLKEWLIEFDRLLQST